LDFQKNVKYVFSNYEFQIAALDIFNNLLFYEKEYLTPTTQKLSKPASNISHLNGRRPT